MYLNINMLLGKTLSSIDVNEDQDEITFTVEDGSSFLMYHSQDCCKCVTIEDIVGDVYDLIDSPILLAEESTNSDEPPSEYHESFTWTFYKLATRKGYVDIRWLGESNGYYSESVNFKQIKGE